MSSNRFRIDAPLILLEHTSSTIHLRGSQAALGRACRHLRQHGVLTSPDLEEQVRMVGGEEQLTVDTRHMTLEDPDQRNLAVGVLSIEMDGFHAYTTTFDGDWGGPFTRFRRIGPPATRPSARRLHLVDYGFEDGVWLFGGPRALQLAWRAARRARIEMAGREKQVLADGALAAHASQAAALQRALDQARILVTAETFRPSGD